jgi:hypothetical protein
VAAAKSEKSKPHLYIEPIAFAQVEVRARAWFRITEAVDEMREALDYRIWREDPDDTHLEHDCRVFCDLTRGLTDFLAARRSA